MLMFLAKVYLMHLIVEHCQTLLVRVKLSRSFLTGKNRCLVLFRLVKMTVKTSKNRQLTEKR